MSAARWCRRGRDVCACLGVPGRNAGEAGALLSHLFPRGCQFPFTFIDRYPIPLLKRHRNARPSYQHLLDSGHASVSCLWNLILRLKCLYKLSQLWTNSCQTISAVPHLCLACVGRACFELKKKRGGVVVSFCVTTLKWEISFSPSLFFNVAWLWSCHNLKSGNFS